MIDLSADLFYNSEKVRCKFYDKNYVRVPRQHLPIADGGIYI